MLHWRAHPYMAASICFVTNCTSSVKLTFPCGHSFHSSNVNLKASRSFNACSNTICLSRIKSVSSIRELSCSEDSWSQRERWRWTQKRSSQSDWPTSDSRKQVQQFLGFIILTENVLRILAPFLVLSTDSPLKKIIIFELLRPKPPLQD